MVGRYGRTDRLFAWAPSSIALARWTQASPLYIDAYISTLTITELYAGVRDDEERERLNRFLEAFEWVNVNGEVAKQAGLYRRDFGKSHGTGIADAVIAACAQAVNATLATLNTKHFPMLNHVVRPYEKS